ncbi:hypothetical protein GCM10022217_30570 [Chryseobacterium ginsenosidimutans]|uniref:hypothetical protein n=1 Tax=Chryseobacterium ginsenosidimutans TaxID=687846 RepID=UPI0031E2D553
MKKLIVLSVLLGSTLLPYNHVSAQSEKENTETQETGKKGGYIYLSNDGCYYQVVTHSILWGLIEWEDEPRQIGCGSGFA